VLLGPRDEALVSAVATAADSLHVAEHPRLAEPHAEVMLNALAQTCHQLQPQVVLLSSDLASQELAPRLAHRLGGSATGDGVALASQNGELHVTRAVYGGKAQATLALKRLPAVVWLRARAFAPPETTTRAAEILPLSLAISADDRIRVVDRQSEARTAQRLEDARFIVSGGRGLGGPEPFAWLEKLAATLHAQMAASRAACDSGWVPASWQVGQTGRKVAPELYLAIAISGASQHLMGIADARHIAAINRDPDAPIFKHCRFGLVEDYRNVIGPLTEKLARLLT
jgi:electron transfer flavoprotein alpha subunit